MADTESNPQNALFHLLLAPIACQAIGTVARLGVADQFTGDPLTTTTIAELVGANADHLRRVLRVLADVGMFTPAGPDAWGITPMGELLRSNIAGSMRHMAIIQTDHAHWSSTGRMFDCVTTGQPQATAALGEPIWEYYQKNPEDADSFSKAMANVSAMAMEHVLAHYDFSGARTIVDVGGAYGALLAAILREEPEPAGILFDLPHVVAQADQILGDVSPRVSKVGGSFLDGELPAGDLYTLKHILHDWNDETCLTILRAIRRAMNPGAKLLVVEFHVPDENATGPVIRLDLLMMVVLDGKERTQAEFADLFARAGLRLTRTIPTPSPFVLIEAEAV